MAFEETETYRVVQEMLKDLRERRPPKPEGENAAKRRTMPPRRRKGGSRAPAGDHGPHSAESSRRPASGGPGISHHDEQALHFQAIAVHRHEQIVPKHPRLATAEKRPTAGLRCRRLISFFPSPPFPSPPPPFPLLPFPPLPLCLPLLPYPSPLHLYLTTAPSSPSASPLSLPGPFCVRLPPSPSCAPPPSPHHMDRIL